VLGAAYTLWMIKRVIFGDIANDQVRELQDINRREGLLLVILAASVLALGVYPAPLVEMMEPTLDNLIMHVIQSKL
jgi:NADH-quinone oxidoreductase subunit M